MSLLVKPFTFSAGATIIAAEHNSNFDTIYTDYNGGITGDNIDVINKASKINGASLTSLTSIPSGAGIIPQANIPATKILGTGSILTIVSGEITVTSSYHLIETEGSASTDDLVTINGGTIGQILILRSADSTRDTTLKDGSPLKLAGDFTLTDTDDTITLICTGTNQWCEVSRSDNA